MTESDWKKPEQKRARESIESGEASFAEGARMNQTRAETESIHPAALASDQTAAVRRRWLLLLFVE